MGLIQEILAKKNLDPQLFERNFEITAAMPIDLHVTWVYNHIYSKPYPKEGETNGIARQLHGLQHVTRAAINIPIFANLFRRYDDEEALKLNDDDIRDGPGRTPPNNNQLLVNINISYNKGTDLLQAD